MRILFLSDNFPPEVNAAATRVYERARYWVQWGHQVTVITGAPNFPEGELYEGYKNRWYQEERIDGIRVIRVKTFMAPNRGTIIRTLDFISYMFMSVLVGIGVKRPDVVVATSPQFFAGLGGALLSKFKRRPFVLELSDLWPDSIEAVGALRSCWLLRFLKFWERLLYRSSQAIVPVTRAFYDNLRKKGVPADKMTVIRNGVDTARYEPQTKDETLVRELGLNDHFTVGYIGTLGLAHDLENVLLSAYYLQEQTAIKFLLVGSGANREHLTQLSQQWGLRNVVFVPRQPKNKVAQYWSLCDVALVHLKDHPVFAEAIPSKMFEAMAMAKAVIMAMPQGEASEILLHERAGLYVTPGSPTELADAIDKLYRNPGQVQKMAESAYQAAFKYSRRKQAEDMLGVLNGVITEPAA